MQKTTFERRASLRFKHFTRRGYALFSCLGREVVIGTLSVATLSNAKAEGVSVRKEKAEDTLQRTELKLDEVVVTGSRAPLTQAEAAKIVSVITRDDIQRAAVESVNDLLKTAIGVDVRQRGGFGVQTDISICGGTYDQVAILLNGVNISNPQTGHFSADFPVSLDDIVRIEIIEGASSRVYGASAFNGAINIVTRGGETSGGSVSAEGGSYGTFGMTARGSIASGAFANSLSAGYKQSDGGTENSYFRKSQAFYQGSYKPRTGSLSRAASNKGGSTGDKSTLLSPSGEPEGGISWQLGMSTMRYGANTFYSAAYPDQYESNARIFASVKADAVAALAGGRKIHIVPSVYWNRYYDHFQLIRGKETGENFHRTDVYGISVNAYTDWSLGRTAFGADVRQEGILSTNLGRPLEESEYVTVMGHGDKNYTKREQRTDVSYFMEHNFLLRDFTASLGVVANMNTAYNSSFRFYPGVDLSYRPAKAWKMTVSWNMAFRMPTFTDLFYKSPTLEGNKDLKPEKTQSLRVGVQYRSKGMEARLGGFYDWGKDMIDWVMYSPEDVYRSANFKLDNRGYEVAIDLLPREVMARSIVSRLRLGYAYIDQKRRDGVPIFKSNYAMEYLRHKFVAGIDHKIVGNLTASWAFRWQQRMGSYIVYENNKSTGVSRPYTPFGLLDVKLLWTERRYELSLTMNNLTSYRYHDLGNIPQPGFWLMAGAKIKINK